MIKWIKKMNRKFEENKKFIIQQHLTEELKELNAVINQMQKKREKLEIMVFGA